MENEVLGREAELAAVGRLLDGVADAPRAVAVDGAAGIGKTTLWAAGVGLARGRGFRVLQAQPAESEADLSYAALADLVGDVFDGTRSRLPVVQERALGASLLREEAEGAAAPRTTATALVGVLAVLAEREPVLLAVDDVQWLDRASEEAVAFAVRRLPPRVGVLVARRSPAAADPPLGLARALPEDRLEHVVLGPLSLAGLHHLIAQRLGSPLPRPLLVRVAEASGGNPFFALELARAAARDSGASTGGEPLRVPPTLEELVGDRLRALSPAAREAALATAALSRPSAAVVGASVEGGRDALLEAEEAGVLVSERGRIRFTHPLLASALYASAAPERRRRLHERLADVVSDPEERARHLALSATEPDARTADVLERAAARAARRGAPHAAAELYAASGRLTPAAQDEEQTRRVLGEASALLSAGDAAGAQSRAEAAAGSEVGALRAEALALLGDIAWVSGGGASGAYFEQALAAAPGDGALAARVYPKLVTVTIPFPRRAVDHADAALRVLSAEQYPAALASIVFERLWAASTLGQGWDLELYERWRELEEQAGPEAPKSRIPLIYFHCVDDVEAARARHAVEDRWYADRGEDLWRAERLTHLANAELRAGNVDVAERYLEDGCAAIAHVQKVGPWAAPMRFRSHVDAYRGRIDRARETLLPLVAGSHGGHPWWEALVLASVGFVEFAAGDHAAADGALTRMHERVATIRMEDVPAAQSEPYHVEALVALGELDRAHDVLVRLENRGRVWPRLWIDVTLPRARALVLSAEGDVETAIAELERVDAEKAAALPFDLAWNRLVQGRLYRRAKRKRAAADALGEAVEIFERLGAPRWVEQARSELDRVGLRRAPEELTATERRVAELAARGMTNREVAAVAFMSPKTVEANLARVYRKLGIRSRAELGARIAQK